MSELSFIGISERAYKYIRQFTIKSVDDAMVELITNAIDAYGKSSSEERLIEIDILSDSRIAVRDRALGLVASELETCFLQVGSYTADQTSRGFFSRGAKDISSLGDIYFRTIKNGLYSSCLLNTDAYGMIMDRDEPVTDAIRDQIKIPAPYNGLEVVIKLLPNFASVNVFDLHTSLSKLGVLRDIVLNKRNVLVLRQFNSQNVMVYEKRIQYQYPADSRVLVDIQYVIPDYRDEEARFVVMYSPKPFPQPLKESQMEFGFLIKDDTTVYEVNTIDDRFRWNPYMNYVYGWLWCPAIKRYLLNYDQDGPTAANPYPIIDPSRLTGINKQHPLIKGMLAIPQVRLDLILRELNSQISAKSVTIEDIDELISELSKYGIDVMESEQVAVKFIPNYDTKLIKTVANDRENYVTYENNYPIPGSFALQENQTDRYVQDEIHKIEDGQYTGYSYILGPDKQLIQIPDSDTIQPTSANITDLIKSEDIDKLKVHPYIYRLDGAGQLIKAYIFAKGTFDQASNEDEEQMITRTKQFSIEFINDLNNPNRYLIDNSNGIKIKLNMNNPVINRHMTQKSTTTRSLETDIFNGIQSSIQLSTISSTKTLTFFKELMTDVLATIIVESDTENGKLVLDSANVVNNIKKANEYYNLVVSRIEMPINNILERYIHNNTQKKVTTLYDSMVTLQSALDQKLGSTDPDPDLVMLTDQIKCSIRDLVE